MKQYIKILHYPFFPSNPYQNLLFDSVNNNYYNCKGKELGEYKFFKELLFNDYNILHLHWINGVATANNIFVSFFKSFIFYLIILLFKMKKKCVVWTVHNLYQHERKRDWLDRLNSIFVARLSTNILVHGSSIIPLVCEHLKISDNKIKVIYHGNYNKIIKFNINLKKNNTNSVKFLFFGMIKPYKGIPSLLKSFAEIQGNHKLHIAGLSKFNDLTLTIKDAIIADPDRISADLEYLSDEKLEELLNWANVVVLPFKDVFTSGSVLMALSAGRPVIAPNIGMISEYLNENCSFLYSMEDPVGLLNALNNAIQCENLHEMSIFAKEQANNFEWDIIGINLREIYDQCLYKD